MEKQIPRSLIVDEIVHMSRQREKPVRIRIWAGKGSTTIALLSQQPGSDPPNRWSAPLANLVVSGFLFHRMPLPSFYETSVINIGPIPPIKAMRVNFSVIGKLEIRPILRAPVYQVLDIEQFARSFLASTGCRELF